MASVPTGSVYMKQWSTRTAQHAHWGRNTEAALSTRLAERTINAVKRMLEGSEVHMETIPRKLMDRGGVSDTWPVWLLARHGLQ